MSLDRPRIQIGFVGGGPRSVGIIERLIANAPLLTDGADLNLIVFDVYPAGPGRIWRYDQSPSLKMNSLAEDVAVFTDASCQMEGPVVTGPTLAEWFDQVRAGQIPFSPPDDEVARELAEIGPQGFATRRLFSCYMRWYFEHVRSLAPDSMSIPEVRGEVTAVRESGQQHVIEFTGPDGRLEAETVDLVVYAVGHTDTEPTSAERETARQAETLGLHYWPAQYANDSDIGKIPPREPVLVRGLGLSFIDVVVRLTLDRGGREIVDPSAPPGWRTRYVPSGNEPRIYAGSGRGVPYHSKITSHFHGDRPGLATTFVTHEAIGALLDAGAEVDFERDVWPLIVREMAYWHYREIFTGHPNRVLGSWEDFSEVFREEEFESERLTRAIEDAVTAEDVFSIAALDRPLDGVLAESLAGFQETLAAYIERDIFLRESEEHSETLAVFWAALASYLVVAESLGHPAWSAESRLHSIPHRWHQFFSYLDSGPPASRLELVLALMRANLLTFLGGGLRVQIDDERKTFVAGSPHQPESIEARYLIEAFHPESSINRSTNPALRDIVASGQGGEQLLPGSSGPVSTRKLSVDFDHAQVIRPDGSQHDRRFAVGDFTSSPPAGAFSRPNTNGRIFRENDRIARTLLETVATIGARLEEPTLIG